MKTYLSLIFTCFILEASLGQTYAIRTNEALTNLRNSITVDPIQNNPKLKGSPYFEERFMTAEVRYFDLSIKDKMLLRYNAYSDEIEIGMTPDQKTAEEIVLQNQKIICSFGNKTYHYLPYIDKNNRTQTGYLIELYRGNQYALYKQEKKVYREATVARTSLERPFPPRFIDEFNYFLSKKNKPIYYLGSTLKQVKKSLPVALSEKARKHNINIKKTKHIQTLIELMKK